MGPKAKRLESEAGSLYPKLFLLESPTPRNPGIELRALNLCDLFQSDLGRLTHGNPVLRKSKHSNVVAVRSVGLGPNIDWENLSETNILQRVAGSRQLLDILELRCRRNVEPRADPSDSLVCRIAKGGALLH